jgi:hypothetical protein
MIRVAIVAVRLSPENEPESWLTLRTAEELEPRNTTLTVLSLIA